MKKIFTLIAVALLAAGSLSAQTMTLKIEGREVHNGDNVVVNKLAKETALNPVLKLYDFGVEVEFKTLIDQTVETTGIDLDKTEPGLACCPTGFTCTTANSGNNWESTGTMNDLTAGREVNGEWIHYNYGQKKPAEGTTRKSTITFKGASETITFNLTMTIADPSGITEMTKEDAADAPAYNIAGQKIGANAKGIVVKNGKKYIVK